MPLHPMRYVERIRVQVWGVEELRLLNIEVWLSPFYYEQCLIMKGLPHSLGVLSQWGPYYEQRPLKEWRGRLGLYPLHFQPYGMSKVTAYDPNSKGPRGEYAIAGG